MTVKAPSSLKTGSEVRDVQADVSVDKNQNPKTYRTLGPLGGLVFFGLVIVSMRLIEPPLETVTWGRWEPIVLQARAYAIFIFLPLAYAFYPQVFTKRHWRMPRNSWKWIGAVFLLNVLLLPLGGLQPSRISLPVAFGAIFVVPPLEEIVRAVMICSLIKRWGIFWGVVVTAVLTTLVHPAPMLVAPGMFALTIMFVATDKSIAATTLAHSMANATLVVVGYIWGG
jgi:hypothetical protein